MNLKHLKDSELLSQTKTLVQSERLLLTKVLHHLREVERRRLFSDLGYQSLFEYAVKDLKYSEGQAGRRIQAMRLLNELPEIEGKIASGALSLSNISQAQSYFRSVQKKSATRQISINLGSTDASALPNKESSVSNRDNTRNKAWHQIQATNNNEPNGTTDTSINKSKKLKLLESLENKSAREGQKVILSIQPETLPHKERERVLSDDKTEIKFVITAELKTKLSELRALLGTKGAIMNFSELINYMADICIQETKIKKFGKKRVLGATGTKRVNNPLNTRSDLNANKANKNAERQAGLNAKVRVKEENIKIPVNIGKSKSSSAGQAASKEKPSSPVSSCATTVSELLRSNGKIRCLKKTASSPTSDFEISQTEAVSGTNSSATPTLELHRRKKSNLSSFSILRIEKDNLSDAGRTVESSINAHNKKRVDTISRCDRISVNSKNTPACSLSSLTRTHNRKHSTSNNLRYISQALRFEIWMRDGGQCTKCGSRRHLNIDHIKPLAMGGETCLSNLRLLCFHCNHRQAIKVFGAIKTSGVFH